MTCKWIINQEIYLYESDDRPLVTFYSCSNCGYHDDVNHQKVTNFNFCPNCGADMGERKNRMMTAKYFKYDEEYNLRPIYNDDVVEVVRCEDCVHHYKGNCYRIEKVTLSVNADDFCSRGDRRETE